MHRPVFRPMFRCMSLVLAACVMAGGAQIAQAAQVPLVRAYQHQAWGQVEGAPAQVRFIAQTSDGYLWLSSDHGLYRFDGTYFEHMQAVGGQSLHSEHVVGLLSSRDGGLWVGYRDGGATLFKDGVAHYYGDKEGLPRRPPVRMTQAPDGSIWFATDAGLYQFQDGRWRRVGKEQGLASLRDEAYDVMFARDGTQWVGTTVGVFRRRPGEAQFTAFGPPGVQAQFFAEAPDGAIWASDADHVIYQLSGKPLGARQPTEVGAVWFDRGGSMWLAGHASMERIPPGAVQDASQRITTDNGLSGAEPQCFFEDRSGNIWVGTLRGLDRFRPYRVQPLPTAIRVVSPALARGHNGSVWVSENNLSARRFDVDGTQLESVPYPFAASVTTADGSVRLASRRGIWIEDEHGGSLLPTVPEALAADLDISSIGIDDRGSWWASFRGLYLGHYVDGAWRRASDILPIGSERPINMLTDSRGQLWMAFFGNKLLRYGGGKGTMFGAEQGLLMGDVSVVHERRGNLWVGGSKGLAYFDGTRFHMLTTLDQHALAGVGGIVETASGELWVRAYEGLFRLRAAEVKAYLNGGAAPSYTFFDGGDGVPGPNGPIGPFPSLLDGGDGRLWMTGNDGVATLVPARLQQNTQAPLVAIRMLSSNGTFYTVAPHTVLPAGSNNLRISFSALNLSRPERTTFRYRLLGVDAGWQLADSRREAIYTNLEPGSYRFEVTAVNEDGVASPAPAALVAVLTPTFVHSLTFKLLCAAVAAALLAALVYIVRLRHKVGVMEARHLERTVERQRIARVLHDTLLQESQGAILLLQVARNTIAAGHPARDAIGRVIGFMEEALADGRDEVMGLRGGRRGDALLHVALQRCGQRLAENLAVQFSVHASGEPYLLDAAKAGDVYAIAREATVNAFRHAGATRIMVAVDYGATALTVCVSDDGKGLRADVDLEQGRHGHYGLTGMRERASRIGAELRIGGADGGGTRVALCLAVPAPG